MKRLKTLKPSATQKTANPASPSKLIKTVLRGALLSLAAIAVFAVALSLVKARGPHGTITDATRIAAYDAEFADFIGSGHKLAEYRYVDAGISHQLGFGYGPLYDVAGYQIIIGQTGAVAAIAYGDYAYGRWNMYPGPDSNWSAAYILVFDGCVAPQEWWNRPVLASMLYGVPTTDGRYLPELMVWVPWPDWFDFDNPPADATVQAQSWYWDGSQFTPTNFVDNQFPLISASQVRTTAPARGLSSWRVSYCIFIQYDMLQ